MQRQIAWRKRLFDVAGAAGGLVAFSPVMAAIAVAILLEDGRPILFRQERVGKAAWWPYRSRSTRSEKPEFDSPCPCAKRYIRRAGDGIEWETEVN